MQMRAAIPHHSRARIRATSAFTRLGRHQAPPPSSPSSKKPSPNKKYPRHWVTSQAQAEIDREFERLKRHRESAISEWITRKGGRLTHAERERLNHDFKKGVDEDWRAAIRKYPEVLDYFYRRVTRAVHSGHAFEGIELRKGHRHTY
ncbi:hypothetical protein RUND412_000210 [Rhizina undulata]